MPKKVENRKIGCFEHCTIVKINTNLFRKVLYINMIKGAFTANIGIRKVKEKDRELYDQTLSGGITSFRR